MISSKCLGVTISSEVIRFALISRRLNRYQLQGLLAISEWQSKPTADLKKQVAEFLKLQKAGQCLSVLAVPRQETVMRQLTLPLDAEANLSKVVEYQLVNLLPDEDAAIAYDYAAQKQEGTPGSLRVSVFLVSRTVLDRYLQLCDELGIRLARVVPSGVALANCLALLNEHFKTQPALCLRLEGSICETAGISDQRLVLWREAALPPEGEFLEFLRTESDLFRSQARLAEDSTVEVLIAGEIGLPQGLDALKLKCRLLNQPATFGLTVGGSIITSRQMQEHLSSVAAAISCLKRKVAEPVNLLPAERRVRRSAWQAAPAYGLLAVNSLLILALLIRGRVQESIFSAQLSQEISRLEPEIKKVRKVEEQMGELLRRAAAVTEFKGRNAEVLGALAELSVILSKDTFVTDLNFKAGVIEINGLSGTAAALPQIIDNSPRFKDVEFVAAITRSTLSADKEGYRVRLKLEAESKRPTSLPGQPTSGKPVVASPPEGAKAEPARERKP